MGGCPKTPKAEPGLSELPYRLAENELGGVTYPWLIPRRGLIVESKQEGAEVTGEPNPSQILHRETLGTP